MEVRFLLVIYLFITHVVEFAVKFFVVCCTVEALFFDEFHENVFNN